MKWPDLIAAAVAVLYLATAIGYAILGQRGLALAFTCYALANVGLVWAALEGRP